MKKKELVPAEEREIHIAEILLPQENQPESLSTQATRKVINNFPMILTIAGDIVRTQQQISQSTKDTDNRIRELNEKMKALREETNNYVTRKQLSMNDALSRMNTIRAFMQDFYANNNGQLSSEAFSNIITALINSDKV